jgi:hypothetical protein
MAPIWKYLSPPEAVAVTIVSLISIALGMYWLGWLNQKDHQIGLRWLLFLYFIFIAAFTVLYPLSLRHTVNHGSDREDALRIEIVALQHHQYPYDARTFLGNPPTPLPGAVILAVPFFALGHIAWQNILWLTLFFCFTIHFFRYRATALLFLIVFLLLAPSNLSDFVSGGDYLVNFFYVAIAMALLIRSLYAPLYLSCLAAAFLGLTLSSRSIYIVAFVPLLVLIFQRTARFRAVLSAAVLATAVAITLPVFMPYPVAHLVRYMDQVSTKLRYIPPTLHSQWTLPLLGVLVICSAFFIRMDSRRLFLLFGLSSFVMLAPPIITLAIHVRRLPFECSYLSISALSFSLWALASYERIHEDDKSMPQHTSAAEVSPCLRAAMD